MDILEKISYMRTERGWSEYQLSVKTGLTQSTISSWYRKNTLPTIPSLERVCDAFGISMAQFFLESHDHEAILSDQQERMFHYMTRLSPEESEAVAALLEAMCRAKEKI